MKKISFSQLEIARKNPTAIATSLNSQVAGKGRFSKYMAWQYAVFYYHKQKGDLSKAITYFETMFQRHFKDNPKNERERKGYVEQLIAYAADERKHKLTYLEHKKRISIPLTGKLRLGGELPLIKMNDKYGYSVYFFSRKSAIWETELRFPIVQNFVAQTLYNVDLSEVEVGVYGLDLKKHVQLSYSTSEISDAVKELQSVGNAISAAL
jgi:hypothetical protein